MLKVLSTSFQPMLLWTCSSLMQHTHSFFCCTQPSERRKYKPGFGREKHCHLCSVTSIMITEPYVKSLPASFMDGWRTEYQHTSTLWEHNVLVDSSGVSNKIHLLWHVLHEHRCTQCMLSCIHLSVLSNDTILCPDKKTADGMLWTLPSILHRERSRKMDWIKVFWKYLGQS